jgi:hypothetical protein
VNAPLRAIETQYRGYRFRSRLEARWAVFFDALDMKWEYEKEGYELPDGTRYLPDFFVRFSPPWAEYHPPGGGYWFEIKPAGAPTDAEKEKAHWLSRVTPHAVYILCGDPGDFCAFGFHRSVFAPRVHAPPSDMEYEWFVLNKFFVHIEHEHNFHGLDAIANAIREARSARFERRDHDPARL